MPLWKRCRVLANKLRLDMLAFLGQHKRLYVKAVAERFDVAEDVASKNLQLLAQAGFLDHKRQGKFLYYSLVKEDRLLRGIMNAIRQKTALEDLIFLLTGFTHERRVSIVFTLTQGSMKTEALCRRTQISPMAMRRQMEKLERRGYVSCDKYECKLLEPESCLGRELIAIAKEDFTLAQV